MSDFIKALMDRLHCQKFVSKTICDSDTRKSRHNYYYTCLGHLGRNNLDKSITIYVKVAKASKDMIHKNQDMIAIKSQIFTATVNNFSGAL